MNRVQNEHFTIYQEDDILVEVFDVTHIDLEIAKFIVKERRTHFKGDFLCIIESKKGKISITKEARDYFSSEEGSKGVKKMAVIANSLTTLVIANFIVRFYNPKIPIKLFKNRASAKKWLRLS